MSTIPYPSRRASLERGTAASTGPGIGTTRDPKISLRDQDDMRVEIEGTGTLMNTVYFELSGTEDPCPVEFRGDRGEAKCTSMGLASTGLA